jgi:hypothetical protein
MEVQDVPEGEGEGMSYGEYGGRVYRDGVRIRSREDAPICVQWSCHAVLGDGPVKLGLYKQADVFVFLDGKKLDVLDLLVDPPEGAVMQIGTGDDPLDVLDTEVFRRSGRPCVMEAGGCRMEVFFTDEDNYYQYARLTQPDGMVWLGWSGYGVGTGDDAYYGDYSAAERDRRLMELFGVKELEGGGE